MARHYTSRCYMPLRRAHVTLVCYEATLLICLRAAMLLRRFFPAFVSPSRDDADDGAFVS